VMVIPIGTKRSISSGSSRGSVVKVGVVDGEHHATTN
jgi:hypothetical protein